MKKLTLSLDEDIIEFAHKLAKEKNDSISNMVGEFFRNMHKNRKEYVPRNPVIKSLYGYYKGRSLPNSKKEMQEILLQKHLK